MEVLFHWHYFLRMQNVRRENKFQHKRVAENIILSSSAPHPLANDKDGPKVLLVEYEQTTMKISLEMTFDMIC